MTYSYLQAGILLQGAIADRPAASVGEYWYLATDEAGGTLYHSDGASWAQVASGVSSAPVTSVFGRTGAVTATSGDYTAAEVTNAADKSSSSQQTFTGNVDAPALIAAGLTGSVAASRYVGATASGAPASGAHLVGDYVIAQDGHLFVCTAAGTPGTWVDVGSAGAVSSVFSRTGAVVAADGDYYGVVAAALTGATQASRYAGATSSGAPVSGTFASGDFVVAQDGSIWVCTAGGSPGTWANVGGSGGAVSSVFGRTGAVTATSGDYDYSKISNSANAIAVSNLVAGSAGQVLGGTGPSYNYPPGYEIGYDQITSNVSVTSTTESSGTSVIGGSSYTFDGNPVIAEFFSPQVITPNVAAAATIISLFEGSTQIGRIAVLNGANSSNISSAILGKLRFTPSAASHTYSITAFHTGAAAGSVNAGSGGTGALVPAYLRFTKV